MAWRGDVATKGGRGARDVHVIGFLGPVSPPLLVGGWFASARELGRGVPLLKRLVALTKKEGEQQPFESRKSS